MWAAVGVRLGVLALLAIVALGLAADSPASLSGEPWALRRPDPQVVGVVLLVALGLGVVVLVLSLLKRSDGEPLPARRPRWPGVLFLLLVVALLVGVQALRRDDDPGEVTVAPPTPAPTPQPVGDAVGSEGGSSLLVLGLIALVVVVSVLAARLRPLQVEEPVAEVEPDALGVGLAAAAGSLRDSGNDGPRDRVIAAYVAFEQALAGMGATRSPSTTPARLLADAVERGAPDGPASVLTELFTRARYSDRSVTSRDVSEAEQALATLLVAR